MPHSTATDTWPHAAILVVDDEPGMRHFLEKALAPRVREVMGAGSAEEAERLLRSHRYDLVLLDIALPGRNGIDLLRNVYAGILHGQRPAAVGPAVHRRSVQTIAGNGGNGVEVVVAAIGLALDARARRAPAAALCGRAGRW